MNNYTPIDASRARSKFFDILEKVYLKGEIFLVRKSGIPMAKIVKPISLEEGNIMDFAGIWKDLDAEKMLGLVKKGREDRGKLKRVLPKIIDVSS
jgi:hypothetical protein